VIEPELLRAPPHSLEAEQSLLGGLLVWNNAYDHVSWLEPEAFYRNQHQIIYRAIRKAIEAGRTADIVTLAEELTGVELERAGGLPYIAELAQNTPSVSNLKRYAEIIRDKWILRQLAMHAMDVADRALNAVEDPRLIAEEAGAAFLDIKLDNARSEMVSMGHALIEAVEWADNPAKGLPTGFRELDDIMRGLMPGDLIIIAGRPSMGKTSLAMNIAEHNAAAVPVAVFSLEMQDWKIAGRSLKYHQAMVGRDQAVDHLSELKLHIDDSPAIGLGHMRLRLRRMKRQHGVALAIVDYLQLMTARAEKRHEEVAIISRGLKAIAKELEIPIIAVSQLNRGSEGRLDHRPTLADLRESGQIEQDADIIAFTYREEYYKPDTPWRGIAEVIVRKNRDGPIGTAYLDFVAEYTRFKARDGLLPARDEPASRSKVKNFEDFKTKASGGE